MLLLALQELPWDLLPEGVSVTAVVATVVLFLKHQKAYADRLHDIGAECHTQSITSQRSYQEAVQQLSETFQANLKIVVDRFGDRMDGLQQGQQGVIRALERIEAKVDGRNHS